MSAVGSRWEPEQKGARGHKVTWRDAEDGTGKEGETLGCPAPPGSTPVLQAAPSTWKPRKFGILA